MYYASQQPVPPFNSYVHNQHKGFEDVYRVDFSKVKKNNLWFALLTQTAF